MGGSAYSVRFIADIPAKGIMVCGNCLVCDCRAYNKGSYICHSFDCKYYPKLCKLCNEKFLCLTQGGAHVGKRR